MTDLAAPPERGRRPEAAPLSALVLPSHEEPLVAALSDGAGGPVGRHARLQDRRRWWTALRVLLALTVVTCTLGWAQKTQCRDVRHWGKNGGGYQYTRVCYSDVVALYGTEGLGAGRVPYVDHPVEYPVLTGAVMGAVAAVTRQTPDTDGGVHRSALFYDLTVLLLALAALVTVVCTGLTARRRLWDAALIALAPTLLLHLGTNWDLLAVALASGGLLAWSRRRPGLAGVLLGAAVATKLYPALFFVPLLALCWRAGRLRAFGRAASAALATFVVVNAPFWLTSPRFATEAGSDGTFPIVGPSPWQALRHGGVGAFASALSPWSRDATGHVTGSNGVMRFWHLNSTRGADWDSLWLWLDKVRPGQRTPLLGPLLHWPFAQTGATPQHLNLGVALLVLAVTAGVLVLGLLAPRRPRLPQLLWLMLVGFLIVNKVDSPQYTLWLLPVYALARPRWRPFLVWQVCEVALTVTRFQYFVGLAETKAGVGYPWFATTVLLRDAVLLVISALVVRDVLRPAHDPVRATGDDDPAGGVLDEAPDTGRGVAAPHVAVLTP